jgi:hypothetical protein
MQGRKPMTDTNNLSQEKLGSVCADGGECHHHCKEQCFRRQCCQPFSDYNGPWSYTNTNNPYAVEGDFSFIQPQPFTFCFSEGDKEVGRLFLEEDHLKFEGNADESAKVFFDEVLRLWDQNKGSTVEPTVAQIAPVHEPDCVFVPRDLVGAAGAAIEGKHDAPKTLEQLRRYTTGDLSTPPAAQPAPAVQEGLAAVAFTSKVGNDQHHHGEPLHWDKSKNTDHLDCLARHIIDKDSLDTDGVPHMFKIAWRALALLETALESGTINLEEVIKSKMKGNNT